MSIHRSGLAWTTLGEQPAWFVIIGLAAGLAVALSARASPPSRRTEPLALATAGVIGVGAALPDTEMVILLGLVLAGATAVVGIVELVGRPGVPTAVWTAVAAVTGFVVTWVLFDGARGRPGTILLAVAVAAPVVAVSLWPGPSGIIPMAARTVVALATVVLVARHTGLGDGTLRPALGGLAGAVVLGLAQRTADGRHTGRSPTSG